jgi:hypothetical protein
MDSILVQGKERSRIWPIFAGVYRADSSSPFLVKVPNSELQSVRQVAGVILFERGRRMRWPNPSQSTIQNIPKSFEKQVIDQAKHTKFLRPNR